jgi:DNA helicase-2/ATP-dependent DNA helicase PcrA
MGSSTVNKPSRYLSDIPQHLISSGGWWQGEERQIATAIYSRDKPSAPSPVTQGFKAGDHVRHDQFGEGVVVSCQPVKDDSEVVVVFKGVGVKKLSLSFARLEKVE